MDDDLFRPTIAAEPRARSSPPWRPQSIFYPAFFGGALAATVLGVLNGRRLALRPVALLAIVATGIAAVVARTIATYLVQTGSGRIFGSAAGLVVWLVIMALQRRPFRLFRYPDREPASLVGAGFAAVIGCGIVEALIVMAAVASWST